MKKILDKVLEVLIDVTKFISINAAMAVLVVLGIILIFVCVILDTTILSLFRAIRDGEPLAETSYEAWMEDFELIKDFFGSDDED